MRGKLSPRYIGPHEIIEKLNPISYHLDLRVDLKYIHNVFHISQLKKYVLDPNHAIVAEPIQTTKDLVYEKHPVQVLDHRIKQLRNKQTSLVKILWANHISS